MTEQWEHTDAKLAEQWTRIRALLRAEVGDAAFNSWLKPLTLGEILGTRLRIAVPTRFMRDWIEQNYGEKLTDFWKEENPNITQVEVIVEPQRTNVQAPLESLRRQDDLQTSLVSSKTSNELEGGSNEDSIKDETENVQALLDKRFIFKNFIVGRTNELAHAAARRAAESDQVQFNPLFLFGSVGLGKTHLMHAIAWHITERDPKRRVLYMSAEKFMYQFIRALRFRTTMDFKEQFRSVDVLMIDDIQFICGKESTQEEFFHTFNALVDQNRQIVVSADKSPSDLDGMEERLRSRLGCGLVADIHPTDYELRLSILQDKAHHLGADLPDKVLEFLAHKITSNVRELEGALNRIVAQSTLVGRPISLETTQEVLRDLLRANDRRVTIEEIQKKVAEHFNIRLVDMHSARRARAVARPRQVAMYLSKQLTARSLPEIGRKFGGRDHTTVMHAVKKVEELRSTDNSFHEDVELLKRMLEI
ncbi:MAG: chromosomal replication initiator protein DnaA [Alphaproteobacteria bacterium]|jgi:chromosomal replication initiator protein|nr:chromosomal replication initiator protein DnaA [Alphaproteobacteria bacterium]PPR14170.1 MAG: Chromosomal replication initiator protein DnaA [Alphaproteobacteria bacterium MarineAlpha12_Bin1]|tara:strand:+ start:31827 stop:33257 length:1431 start_codon:yes stop_codon:yes gene_type:complete